MEYNKESGGHERITTCKLKPLVMVVGSPGWGGCSYKADVLSSTLRATTETSNSNINNNIVTVK